MRWNPLLFAVLILSSSASAADKSSLRVERWSETSATCKIRQGNDGRTYYVMSSGDVDVTLAVDSKELEKIPHRATPMLSVLLSFHYRGNAQLAIKQEDLTLEFVKHSQIRKSSLDPDNMLEHIQQNVDDLTDEVERHEVRKHPEAKAQVETELQTRLKEYAEMMDFISTKALRSTVLNTMNASVSGWVFFPIKDRWIGPWRKPEQFVLRIPFDTLVLEFPFSLPPQNQKVELRHRDEQ